MATQPSETARVIAEIDCDTNTTVYRPMTAEEIADQDALTELALAREAELLAKKEARDALIKSVRAKLVAGQPLTEEEAAIIVL